jgi:hypothetical protein
MFLSATRNIFQGLFSMGYVKDFKMLSKRLPQTSGCKYHLSFRSYELSAVEKIATFSKTSKWQCRKRQHPSKIHLKHWKTKFAMETLLYARENVAQRQQTFSLLFANRWQFCCRWSVNCGCSRKIILIYLGFFFGKKIIDLQEFEFVYSNVIEKWAIIKYLFLRRNIGEI